MPMARVDDMVKRILRAAIRHRAVRSCPSNAKWWMCCGLGSWRSAWPNGASVLLKNAGNQLPLNKPGEVDRGHRVACRCRRAFGRRFGTGRSSGRQCRASASSCAGTTGQAVVCFGAPRVWYPSSPLKAIRSKASRAKVQFNDGSDPRRQRRWPKPRKWPLSSSVSPPSEGRDTSLTLPNDQDALVNAVAAANPRTIVVLETGGPVTCRGRTGQRGPGGLVSRHARRRRPSPTFCSAT